MSQMVIFSLTDTGKKIADVLETRYMAKTFDREDLTKAKGVFDHLVSVAFKTSDCLVFIMATGIAVRKIAPYLEHKTKDPAVIVIDDSANFVISLISGHLGGANLYAKKIANYLKNVGYENVAAIITTATDNHGVFAFDLFAKKNEMKIGSIECLKKISGRLLSKDTVNVYTDYIISGSVPKNIVLKPLNEIVNEKRTSVVISHRDTKEYTIKHLMLYPKSLILGIGCKRGKDYLEINDAVVDFLSNQRCSIESIKRIHSVIQKKDEAGIIEFSKALETEFEVFDPKELNEVKTDNKSSFVYLNIGTHSVAEAASLITDAEKICGKVVYPGITLALAKEKIKIKWEYEE